MNGIEGAGLAGELLSWTGLILGLPLLLVGTILRSRERTLVPTEVVIVEDGHAPWARWFFSGEIHERRLRGPERGHFAGRDFGLGYVSRHDPSLMRLERRRPITSVCLALGTTFVLVGLCGFAVSIVPLVLA